MSAQKTEERRGFNRIPCLSPVRVYSDDSNVSESFILMASNLSPEGAFLRTNFLFSEGEWLDVEYVVPGRAQPVRGRGRVVRVETEDPGPGMAIRLAAT